ncbi:MAG: hypothetical protein K2I25_01810 [Muribaculaceae bacterium]|nr:hypothetical protein [Muribaculaceae bacterium]
MGRRQPSAHRPEACYCRFTPADSHGRISKILYANWRKAVSDRSQIEEIDLLDPASPLRYAERHVRWCEGAVNTKAGDKHLRLVFTSYSILDIEVYIFAL